MADQGPTSGTKPLVKLTHKHTFAVKNHMLSGITLPAWIRLLWRHARDIDWWPYAPRVLFLSLLAGVNSLLALPDQVLMRRAVRRAALHPEPVFVLGHPRTGTTHLHNLLSLDGEFAWADTLAAGFPSAFLCLGRGLAAAAAPLLDATRPMDAMALSFATPAEDEIAVCAATGGVSPYMPLVFMRDRAAFWDYFTLRRCSDADRARWLAAFTWFLKKVTLRGGGPRPKSLLIKSPVHTARVALLLKLFPRARFLYIHRHPYDVFRSAAHMADSYYVYTALQRMTPQDVTDFVLDQFELLHDTYQQDKHLIPQGNLMELSFQELDGDPVGTLRRVYDRFGWSDRFEALEPSVRSYCGSLADFKKNSFSGLEPGMRRVVAKRWSGYFEAFGYEA